MLQRGTSNKVWTWYCFLPTLYFICLSVYLNFYSFVPFKKHVSMQKLPDRLAICMLIPTILFSIHVFTVALSFVISLVPKRKMTQRKTKFASYSCSWRNKKNSLCYSLTAKPRIIMKYLFTTMTFPYSYFK